jgi:hypothetical protein
MQNNHFILNVFRASLENKLKSCCSREKIETHSNTLKVHQNTHIF